MVKESLGLLEKRVKQPFKFPLKEQVAQLVHMNYIVKPNIIGAVWRVFCCIIKYECCDDIELITLK